MSNPSKKQRMEAGGEHPVVSREEWEEQRKALLAKEKQLTRLKDEVARERRELPWTKVEKDYEFEGEGGRKVRLSELFDGFQNGRNTLLVQHHMFSPEWEKSCRSCSFWADGISGFLPHLLQKTNFVCVVKAPAEKAQEWRSRQGWPFPVLSSFDSSFNRDFGVEFTPAEVKEKARKYNYGTLPATVEQLSGMSVFYKGDDGTVYHTYSCYSRGLDILNGCYQMLDLLPYGRQEEGLSYTMGWVKHKIDY
eukprot:Sspe_Gene.44142::Locus_21635_Transcript_1_1_Confidence_1.000_Length_1171::g.44142::m.44142